MNKKYLIAIDMDGTLLNKKGKVSFLTNRYLRKLSKEGHIVILASGRPIRSLKPTYDKLKLNTPMICYNGIYAYHPNDKSFNEISHYFYKNMIIELYRELYPRYISNIVVENHNDIFYEKDDAFLARFFPNKGIKVHVTSISNIDDNMYSVIMKSNSKKSDNEIINRVKRYENIGLRFWAGDNPEYCELYYKDISKWDSILEIAKYYKIPLDNVITIGDSFNDIEMVKKAKIGIAMINSPSKLKEVADIVTEYDNHHNGIPKTLKKIIKSRD